MAAETSGAGSGEPSVPRGAYIDQDTTDDYTSRPYPRYPDTKDLPEAERIQADIARADKDRASGRKLPAVPPLSEG